MIMIMKIIINDDKVKIMIIMIIIMIILMKIMK